MGLVIGSAVIVVVLALAVLAIMVFTILAVDRHNQRVILPPPVAARPKPKPEAKSPAYLRRWNGNRKAAARRELAAWESEFSRLQLARRAGGLHGSSTAAPVSGG